VVNDPVNWVDPLGLTQRDIDVARQIAIVSQPDLKFPDSYKVMDLGYAEDGGVIVGNTIPGVGTQLDNQYLKPLNNSQAAELLNTIIHEAVHYTLDPKDNRQPDGNRSGYPYDQAKTRTTEKLIKRLNIERKARQCP
jgi:hypothetical protein